MAEFRIWNLQDYNLSVAMQNIELVTYSFLCFIAPLMIGHPQVVVGVIVNAAIVLAALNLKGYRILPVLILPSLGVFTRGVIFGPLTPYLIYMIPFIWIGNLILVASFKHMMLKKKHDYWITLVTGALLKSGFIFAGAALMYSFSLVPAAMLPVMGILQIGTAIAGGTTAYGIHKAKKIYF